MRLRLPTSLASCQVGAELLRLGRVPGKVVDPTGLLHVCSCTLYSPVSGTI
jgi:hypothetical protein